MQCRDVEMERTEASIQLFDFTQTKEIIMFADRNMKMFKEEELWRVRKNGLGGINKTMGRTV